LLQGEFDLYGEHHSCLQKIQVRAPGIRAEACWDTENTGDVDLDLHMGNLGYGTCPQQGWATTCPRQDCYYADCKSGSSGKPAWYSATTPASACVGWGSAASGGNCGNPRLDRDIVSCD